MTEETTAGRPFAPGQTRTALDDLRRWEAQLLSEDGEAAATTLIAVRASIDNLERQLSDEPPGSVHSTAVREPECVAAS